MKTLLSFLNESNITDLRKSIITSINNIEDETVLKRALGVLQHIDDDLYNSVKTIINDGYKYKNGVKLLLHLSEDYNCKQKLFESILNKPDNLITFNELENNENILTICQEKEVYKIFGLDKNVFKTFLEELYTINPRRGRTAVGNGEFLLYILSKNVEYKNGSDIVIDDNTIEVKGANGRLKGNNDTIKSPKIIENKIQEKLGIKEKIKLGSSGVISKSIKSILDKYSDNKDNFIETIFEAFCEAYCYQFIDDNKTINDIVTSMTSYFNIKNITANNVETIIAEYLINIHGCLALASYYNVENFKYILLINKNFDFKIIDLEEVFGPNNETFNNIIAKIKDLLDNYVGKKFIFSQGPGNSKGASNQNYTCQINLI